MAATNSSSSVAKKTHDIVIKVRNAKNVEVEETIRLGFSSVSKARRAYVGKMIMLGDSGVGKSQFVTATQSPFDEVYASIQEMPSVAETIGVEFAILNFEIGKDTLYRLQLWDTAGQERFHSILPMYSRGAMGIIIMYDVTSLVSYESIEIRWRKFLDDTLKKRADDNYVPIMLVGNKIDEEQKRVVDERDARAFAFARGWNYRETTVLSRATVHKAMAEMAADMHYSALRADCASEIVITPDMTASRESGIAAAPSTRRMSHIWSDQYEQKKKGGCCSSSS